MSNEELFNYIEQKINQTLNINSDEISIQATKYIQDNKHKIINFFLEKKNNNKKAFFMAGAPGAGKSETALALQKEYAIDIIDTDEIRRICPRYTGANSDLFQKASSKGVDMLVNESFKMGYSFILDGNFANQKIQEINIQRALKRDYDLKIFYIYRPLLIAQKYTKIREEKEGRRVPLQVFYSKFLQSIQTTQHIVSKYDIELNFYDLNKKTILTNIKNLQEIIAKSQDIQKDIKTAKAFMQKTQELSR